MSLKTQKFKRKRLEYASNYKRYSKRNVYDYKKRRRLDQQSLDLVLDTINLVLDGGGVVGGDRSSDDWSGNTTCSTQSGLGRNENVWNVLVLTQQWQVQQDLNRLSVGSHDDELRNTSVQGLGSLVSTLLQLSQALRLLDNIKNLLSQGRVCQWESFWVRHFMWLSRLEAPCSNSSPVVWKFSKGRCDEENKLVSTAQRAPINKYIDIRSKSLDKKFLRNELYIYYFLLKKSFYLFFQALLGFRYKR